MKLPDDPKERKQLMILGAIMAAGLLFGVFKGADALLLSKKVDAEKKVEELEHKIRKAQKQIKRMNSMDKMNLDLIKEIKTVSSDYILRDQLGSYLLVAQEQMEDAARNSKTTIAPVQEIGIGKMPAPPPQQQFSAEGKELPMGPPATYALRHYTARITVENGLHDMIRIIKEAERVNPYFCVSGIEIIAQEETPGKHEMTFDAQWPIWDDNENNHMTVDILARLREEDEDAPLPNTAPTGGGE